MVLFSKNHNLWSISHFVLTVLRVLIDGIIRRLEWLYGMWGRCLTGMQHLKMPHATLSERKTTHARTVGAAKKSSYHCTCVVHGTQPPQALNFPCRLDLRKARAPKYYPRTSPPFMAYCNLRLRFPVLWTSSARIRQFPACGPRRGRGTVLGCPQNLGGFRIATLGWGFGFAERPGKTDTAHPRSWCGLGSCRAMMELSPLLCCPRSVIVWLTTARLAGLFRCLYTFRSSA